MFAKGALFATAAFGFVVALVEPRGVEPDLPENVCLLLAVISIASAIWCYGAVVHDRRHPPGGR